MRTRFPVEEKQTGDHRKIVQQVGGAGSNNW